MGNLKRSSWLLILYWIPLVNLGPSLHRADFLGLHSHSCGESSCTHDHSHHTHSGDSYHCHKHVGEFANDVTPNIAKKPVVDESQDVCSFCKFFDEYNVIFNAETYLNDVTSTYQRDIYPNSFLAEPLLSATARGPPSCQTLV